MAVASVSSAACGILTQNQSKKLAMLDNLDKYSGISGNMKFFTELQKDRMMVSQALRIVAEDKLLREKAEEALYTVNTIV